MTSTTTNPPTPNKHGVLVEVITDAADFTEGFRCISEAFGRQANDAIWQSFNPRWDTPSGQAAGAARMAARFHAVSTDIRGNPHTVFLKATVPSSPSAENQDRRVIAGLAIWEQTTAIPGHGKVANAENPLEGMDLAALHPDNETEQRFARQITRSLFWQRAMYVQRMAAAESTSTSSSGKDDKDAPLVAVMTLDLCGTDPAYQRRGVATELVKWGLVEGRRRGLREATTEASSMGRHAYARQGFVAPGVDTVYDVDPEFRSRDLPPNIFMICPLGSSP